MGTISQLQPPPNSTPRYVRVTNPNHQGFVEFQFSVGDPSLYLEMTLPPEAFAAFCKEQGTRMLSKEDCVRVDASERRWRFGDDEEE